MIDPQLLRKDIASVEARLLARKFKLDVEKFNTLETERKSLQTRTEELQAKRNQLAKAIGMKKGKGEDAAAELAEASQVNTDMEAGASRLAILQAEIADFLWVFRTCPMRVFQLARTKLRTKKSNVGDKNLFLILRLKTTWISAHL